VAAKAAPAAPFIMVAARTAAEKTIASQHCKLRLPALRKSMQSPPPRMPAPALRRGTSADSKCKATESATR
jgi:hypothetical protein